MGRALRAAAGGLVYHVLNRANPLRAGLVRRAEDWRWGGLWRRERGSADALTLLSDWPVPRPRGWLSFVNAAQSLGEEEAIRHSIRRGTPFGVEGWVKDTVERLGLE